MSKPEFAKSYPRSEVLSVRMSPDEWRLLARLARATGTESLSEAARKAIEHHARAVTERARPGMKIAPRNAS